MAKDSAFPATVPYKTLAEAQHPDYDAAYWRRCQALYAGGRKLLADAEVMAEVFPKHLKEEPDTYKERCKRAYYIPYPGEILDAITAALTAQEVTLTCEPESPDEFYLDFQEDCSRPGGARMSFNQLLRQQVQTALVKRTAWTLIDLPQAPPEGYQSLEAQQAAGGLDAYACPIDPEMVRDWEEDDAGDLVWALVKHSSRRRSGLVGNRDNVREVYTYYTRTGWARYVVEYDKDTPPADDAPIACEDSGDHSFKRVPLDRLTLPEGLWAMGKIESLAVAHLNKRNALSWAELKSLFPVPVAYLGPADPLSPVTDSDDRATAQVHGPGHMRVMGKDDRMEFFGPPTEAFSMAKEDLDGLRDEMHRVLHHMALSVDNSGAALQRSAESKSIDQAAAAVVLRALGYYVREHAIRVMQAVSNGRGDEGLNWAAQGMEKFDDATVGDLVAEAVNLEAVSIPSATFQVLHKFALAKRILGTNATDEELAMVKDELEGSITQEAYETAMDPVAQAGAVAGAVAEATAPFEQANDGPGGEE